jgi:hypothetical protein
MHGERNKQPLTAEQIQYCQDAWTFLCGETPRELDISRASMAASETKFNETHRKVFLGADAYPGIGIDARSSMSPLACLAHELAHSERFEKEYNRPTETPDALLDEAEASLHASFISGLGSKDREDLVADACDRTSEWLSYKRYAL